jgi:hypothetical protein
MQVEIVIAPNIDVVKMGILIGSATKLGNGSNGVSIVRSLNQSSTLPIATTGIVRKPQMVFTNPISTTHVNMIINWPLMSSMAARGCRSADVVNPKRGY